MIIEDAMAGLTLIDSVVTDMKLSNEMALLVDLEDKGTVDMDYEIGKAELKESCYIGEVSLSVNVYYREGRKKMFNLKLTQLGFFAAYSECYDSIEEFRDALEINGVASLISVVRATISAISSNIFAKGSIKLPLVNVYRLKELKDSQKQKDSE